MRIRTHALLVPEFTGINALVAFGRLEATYEIREDIASVLQRVGAFWDDDDKVRFAGWARMSLPIGSFKIIEVRAKS